MPFIADIHIYIRESGGLRYGMYVTDRGSARIERSLLTGHGRAAAKTEKSAELEVRDCIIRDNYAFLESGGRALPAAAAAMREPPPRGSPPAAGAPAEDGDCIKAVG